jgi:hypothetical protein
MNTIVRLAQTKVVRFAAIGVFAASPGCCDTITTVDNLSVHGIIREVTDTTITLEGTFEAGTKSYTTPRDRVVRIDLNSTVYNPGAPPRTLGLGPDKGKQATVAALPRDTIVLKGSTSKPCKLLAIDASAVRCEGSNYPRFVVLSVLIGRR